MLATARARGSGEARQWAAQARSGDGLWCAGARLKHGSGVRLPTGLCANGGSGLLGLG